MHRHELHRWAAARASSAHTLVGEDFVESRESYEDVDHGHEARWQVVAKTIAQDFETPVKTADNEEDKCDFVKFHTYS